VLNFIVDKNPPKMSKNKRKRRLKEEDFKKKKLKVGKKLPMPDNVTRTSFKARSINITQQVCVVYFYCKNLHRHAQTVYHEDQG
jgi:hypothetical protein